jgi:CHAD domain-containing protein
VHKMRVATRRMRSALQAYGKVVDRERTRALTDELKWLAGVLGDARDLEVLEARITDALDATPEELVLGPVRAQVTRFFAARETAARAELLAALDGERYLALLGAIEDLVTAPPLTPAARGRARDRLGAVVGRAHRRVAGHVRRAGALPRGHERDVELHEARKAAKRLRYATEVTGSRPKGLKKLQKALGHHQDVVVARPVLRELGASAENGYSFGVLWGQANARAAAIEAELPGLWRRAKRG